jgi:maltose O-acetyltransferase
MYPGVLVSCTHPFSTSLSNFSLNLIFLGKTGKEFWIEPPFRCDYGYNIELGENFYSNYNLVILDPAKVTIGSNCFIAPNVGIHTAGHPLGFSSISLLITPFLDVERRNKGLEFAYPIKIGDNVWIGAGVNILPGVTIGNNCVIGAGSVVNRDISDNMLAAGVPCKVIREITEADKLKYT